MKIAALRLTRRAALVAALALLGACAGMPAAQTAPPIVFVHGNGDTAALWTTTLWRFESNGWPRDRLHAIDMPYPAARDADDKPQSGRSSTAEAMSYLASEVDAVLAATGASQVVLFGNSRGGNEIRNYVAHGGAAKVSAVILGGAPNHGVWADPAARTMNEFNGAGPFLSALNHAGDGTQEITPGPRWMTIRSDSNDKYAQPDGAWIGAAGRPTQVGYDGPELKGAQNVVIAGIDHRETAYGPAAFDAAYRFIAGHAPLTQAIVPEARVVLDGKVSGLGPDNDPARGGDPTNLPLRGATVTVYATDAETGARLGPPRWRKTVGADGRWGPFAADGSAHYEFVVEAPGYAVTHIYRSPFPRSSEIVNLRAQVLGAADKDAGAVLVLTRPRGYFGLPRNHVVLDGIDPAPGLKPGVAGVAQSTLRLPGAAQRTVLGVFDDERIAGQTWPAAGNHLVQLEIQP